MSRSSFSPFQEGSTVRTGCRANRTSSGSAVGLVSHATLEENGGHRREASSLRQPERVAVRRVTPFRSRRSYRPFLVEHGVDQRREPLALMERVLHVPRL